MGYSIAILEDDSRRTEAMRAWLDDRFYMYEHRYFRRADEMIDWLTQNLEQTLVVSLDHDLEPERDENPGTGRIVADYLAMKTPRFPIVLHSTNRNAVQGMKQILEDAGWSVDTVSPYGDLDWVDEVWWPLLRGKIVDQAVPKSESAAVSGANSRHSQTVISLESPELKRQINKKLTELVEAKTDSVYLQNLLSKISGLTIDGLMQGVK